MGLDAESAAVDGDVAVGTDGLSSVVAGRQVDGDVAVVDDHVAVAFDGGAVGWNVLVVNVFHDGSARCDDVDAATVDGEGPVASDAFGNVARGGDVEPWMSLSPRMLLSGSPALTALPSVAAVTMVMSALSLMVTLWSAEIPLE